MAKKCKIVTATFRKEEKYGKKNIKNSKNILNTHKEGKIEREGELLFTFE